MEGQGQGAGKDPGGELGDCHTQFSTYTHQLMVAAALAMVLSLGLGLAYLALFVITQGKPLI